MYNSFGEKILSVKKFFRISKPPTDAALSQLGSSSRDWLCIPLSQRGMPSQKCLKPTFPRSIVSEWVWPRICCQYPLDAIQQKLLLDWYASMTQLNQPFTQKSLLCCCQNSWWTWSDRILEACLFSILQSHAGNTPLCCSTSGAHAILHIFNRSGNFNFTVLFISLFLRI